MRWASNSVDALFSDIPAAVRANGLDLPPGLDELSLSRRLEQLARRNRVDLVSFLGAGAYRHHIPATVDQILSRGEFYTAYTPYQPEISQGTLQTIYEYQSLIAELTGLDVVSASHYDGAAATAEAALMTVRATHVNGCWSAERFTAITSTRRGRISRAAAWRSTSYPRWPTEPRISPLWSASSRTRSGRWQG